MIGEPARASTRAAVDALARALYGIDVAALRGVRHVAAVASEGDLHRVLRIGPHAPKSELDLFVLNLARAWAEAIVVTGAVLRAEPELRYELEGPGDAARGLVEWRREAMGIEQAPELVVLTRGDDLPLDHPALHGWARPLVYTTRESAQRLAEAGVRVVGAEAPSVRGAIAHLSAEGAHTIAIEAGPTATGGLYDAPSPVDELWLSVYEGPLDARARGGLLPSAGELDAAGFTRASVARAGPWRFERWVRAYAERLCAGP